MSNKKLLIGYLVFAACLLLYSFTQVDLGLTLTRASFWQVIQTSFQYIGYFNRPLSTWFYLALLVVGFCLYGFTLWLAAKKELSVKAIWPIVLLLAVVLLPSYSAFSYDIFNYIFDAKVITHYHENPYLHKALDFPTEPMLSFMHWTQRTYPYGPVWLGITVPISFLGFGYFLPTYFLFKALMVASYLGSVHFLSKILKKVAPEQETLGLVFFALNPLVIFETLVSGHHDMVMMFLSIAALYLLVEKKYVGAFLLLVLSIGLKYATVFLLPVFVWVWWKGYRGDKVDKGYWGKLFLIASVLMVLPIVLASYRTEMQPWYLIWVLQFVAFTPRRWNIAPIFIISFGLLLTYSLFLANGNWDPPIPMEKTQIIVGSLAIGIASSLKILLNFQGKRSSSQ